MAGENDFLKFNNGKEFNFNNFSGEIKKDDIKDENLRKFLFNSAFDIDGDGVISSKNSKGINEIKNLWNAVKSAATKNGESSVFDDDEIESFLNPELEEKTNPAKVSIESFTNFVTGFFTRTESTEAVNSNEITNKYFNDNGEEIEDTITYFENHKPQKLERKINGQTVAVTEYLYNDASEENPMEFVILTTINSDGTKTIINALDVDKNGNYTKDHFIDRTTIDEEGNSTQVYSMQGVIVENKTKANGKQVVTLYNGTEIADYDNNKLHRTIQQTIENGQVHYVEYDGKGNTITNLNAGDTKERLARAALRTKLGKEPTAGQINAWITEFETLNKRYKRSSYIQQAGETVLVQGEYNADSKFIKSRQTPQQAIALTNQKLAGDFMSAITNEYPLLNQNYSELNDNQRKLVDKALEDCFNRNIRKPSDVKAVLEKKFPNLKLFNSGKVIYPIAKNDIDILTGNVKPHADMRAAYQQMQDAPISVEDFITKILKLNLKTEPGKTVYQRLASLSQETLSTISAQNFGDMHNSTFDQIADRFGLLQIRTPQEIQQKQNSPQYRKEQEHRAYREVAAQNVAIAYDNAINVIRQYQGNQGWLNVGFYREKLGSLLSKINPTEIATCFDDVIKQLEKERDFAVNYLKNNSGSQASFNNAFKQIIGTDYNEDNIKAFLEKAQQENADWSEEYNKAFGVKKVENKKGKEIVTYEPQIVSYAMSRVNFQQYVDGAGDIVLMLLGTEAIGKGVAWAGGKVMGKLAPYVPKTVANLGSKTVMTVGSNPVTVNTIVGNMAQSSATFVLWDSAKNYINLKTKSIQFTGEDADKEWEAYKAGNVESAKFGAFAGLLNSTVVGKVVNATMKTFEKPVIEATKKSAKLFEKSSTVSATDLMKTYMVNQSPKLLAQTAGALAEVAGFTLYETANEIAMELLEKDKNGERHLPKTLTEEGLTSYLMEKLGGQAANLGEIKAISRLLFMHKGAMDLRSAQLEKNLKSCETLKDIVINKANINGREVFEIKYPNGTKEVANSLDEAIAKCHIVMQLDMTQNNIKALNEQTENATTYDEALKMLQTANSARETVDKDGNKVIIYHRNLMNAGDYTFARFDKSGKLVEQGQVAPSKLQEVFGKAENEFTSITQKESSGAVYSVIDPIITPLLMKALPKIEKTLKLNYDHSKMQCAATTEEKLAVMFGIDVNNKDAMLAFTERLKSVDSNRCKTEDDVADIVCKEFENNNKNIDIATGITSTIENAQKLLETSGFSEIDIKRFSTLFEHISNGAIPNEICDFIVKLKENGVNTASCISMAGRLFIQRNVSEMKLLTLDINEINNITDNILQIKLNGASEKAIYNILDCVKNDDGSINENLINKESWNILFKFYDKYQQICDNSPNGLKIIVENYLKDSTGKLNSQNIEAVEYMLDNNTNAVSFLRYAKNKDGIVDKNIVTNILNYIKENSTDPYLRDVSMDIKYLIDNDGKIDVTNKPILDNVIAKLKEEKIPKEYLDYLRDNNGILDFKTIEEKLDTLVNVYRLTKNAYRGFERFYDSMTNLSVTEKFEVMDIISSWVKNIQNPREQFYLEQQFKKGVNPTQIIAIDKIMKSMSKFDFNNLSKYLENEELKNISSENKESIIEKYVNEFSGNSGGWLNVTYINSEGKAVTRFTDAEINQLSLIKPNKNLIDFAQITYKNSDGKTVPRFSVEDLKKFADIELTDEILTLSQKVKNDFFDGITPEYDADLLVKVAKSGTAGNFLKLSELQIEYNGKLRPKYRDEQLAQLAEVKISDNLLRLAELNNIDGRALFNSDRLARLSEVEITDNMVEWAKINVTTSKGDILSIAQLYDITKLDPFKIDEKIVKLMRTCRYDSNRYTYEPIDLSTIQRANEKNNIDNLIKWSEMTKKDRKGNDVPRFSVNELSRLAEIVITDNMLEWANMTYTDEKGVQHKRFNGFDLEILSNTDITDTLKKWADYKSVSYFGNIERQLSASDIITLKDIEPTDALKKLLGKKNVGYNNVFVFTAEHIRDIALAGDAEIILELSKLTYEEKRNNQVYNPKALSEYDLVKIVESGSAKNIYKLANAKIRRTDGEIIPQINPSTLQELVGIRLTDELTDLAIKTRMIARDIISISDFVDFQHIESINELSRTEKKILLKKLLIHSSDIYNLSGKVKDLFPIIPQNKDEYSSLMSELKQSLDIRTSAVTKEQIVQFNSEIGSLANSIAQISDTEFSNTHIEQSFSRAEFVKRVLEKTADLSPTERQKVFDYYGFEIVENVETNHSVLEGYPFDNTLDLSQYHITSEKSKSAVERIKEDIIKFSTQNKITCDNKVIEKLLNELAEIVPEIHSMVGKTQHDTHKYDVLQHSLKVLQKVVQDPSYQNLSPSEQKIMLYASLFHDISKTEGITDNQHADEGSFDAFHITKKLNLTREEQIKLYTLIKNHEWLAYVNSAKDEFELTKRLQSVAFDMQNDNLFELALIFAHADLKAVKYDDSFHDSTEGVTRALFTENGKRVWYMGNGITKVSHGQAAEKYSERIREYVKELEKSRPFTPVIQVPAAQTIRSKITQINPDGSTNFKGVFVDSDGLIVIKFNDVEDWEALEFPKGTTSKGIEGIGHNKSKYGEKIETNFDTGNFKFFAHGLDFAEQLMKFDIFNMPDNDALLSVTYMERPESKYRNFRPQGIGLNAKSKYVYGGGETDAGSGCGKSVDNFKDNYVFGGSRQGDRVFISDLIKRSTGMTDEEYIKFYDKNQNRTWNEVEPIDGSDPVEFRNKLIKAYAEHIVSNVRYLERAYDEFYISNPEDPMFTWVYAEDPNEKIGENPLAFLHRSTLTDNEKQLGAIGGGIAIPVARRTEFLRHYSLDRDKVMFVFGD